MCRTPLLLFLLATTAGCVDATGLRSSCAGQMQGVRFAEGGPPDRTQKDQTGGDFSEVWYYDDSRNSYTFRWGVSYEDCQVHRGRFSRSPEPGSSHDRMP